jgi:hypothetical protein
MALRFASLIQDRLNKSPHSYMNVGTGNLAVEMPMAKCRQWSFSLPVCRARPKVYRRRGALAKEGH